MSDLTASRATKSRAYQFIKSLLKDGADGTDIHNLVTAINENISEDIGGNILMDLLKNPKDKNAEITHNMHWFGPFSVKYFHHITSRWAEYCDDTELRGTFRFGKMKEWKEWKSAGNIDITNENLKELSESSRNQICVFEWWSDAATSTDVRVFLVEIYDEVEEEVNADKAKSSK